MVEPGRRLDQPSRPKRKEHLQPAHSLPPLGFPVIILAQSLATGQIIAKRKYCLGNNEQELGDAVFLSPPGLYTNNQQRHAC